MTKTMTPKLIENFENYLINEEKASATLEKYMRDIKAFFVWIPNPRIDKKNSS